MTRTAALAQRWPGTPVVSDVVHAKLLLCFGDLVDELGGDPDALLRQVGIDPARLSQGEAGVTYRQAFALLELAAATLDCPDFGMRLAKLQRGWRIFGPLGSVMRHSATFGDALDYVGGHIQAHSLAARVWLKRVPGEQALFVGHDILLDRVANKAQAMEQILLLGHLAAMELTDGSARARRIHFRHQPALPARAYRRYFGCDVLFGQSEDGCFFFERDLQAAIVSPDAQVYRKAVAHVEATFGRERPPLHAQVRGLVLQHLGTEQCSNDAIAAELKLHTRTLHRRLIDEGTSFQKVKDEVRRDLMLYYLQHTGMELARISEKLGFAEQSVMTRRCHRWFAASPTAIRRQAPAAAG